MHSTQSVFETGDTDLGLSDLSSFQSFYHLTVQQPAIYNVKEEDKWVACSVSLGTECDGYSMCVYWHIVGRLQRLARYCILILCVHVYNVLYDAYTVYK